MASLDYGCIIKKNGTIITGDDVFTDPINTIGFTNKTVENCHACCGDKDLIFCFRKDYLCVYDGDINEVLYVGYHDWHYYSMYETDIDSQEEYERYQREKAVSYDIYSLQRKVNDIELNFKRLDRGNRYKLRFWYKGDLYEVIYGYGVDTNLKYFYGLADNKKAYIKKWLSQK